MRIPGSFTISIDGVQVSGASNLFTKSKGPVTQYVDLIQLEERVHVKEAEAAESCKIILNALAADRGKCASIAVDNAGVNMITSLIPMLQQKLVL